MYICINGSVLYKYMCLDRQAKRETNQLASHAAARRPHVPHIAARRPHATQQPAGHMPHSSPQATCYTAARRPQATAALRPHTLQPAGHTDTPRHCSPQATCHSAARKPPSLQPAGHVTAARRPHQCYGPQAAI